LDAQQSGGAYESTLPSSPKESLLLEHDLIYSVFMIFGGAAVLATLALLTRQSLLVAYMVLGVVLGPWCFRLVGDSSLVQSTGNVGIIFLLFLLGLHLPPQKLAHMLKKVSMVGLWSSLLFASCGFMLAMLFHYSITEAIVIGAAMMFSSTIIGIKLLPTTILHHQHTGEIMISVLLLQDLIAILVLLFMHAATVGGVLLNDLLLVVVGFPAILLFAYLFERFVLLKLFSRFNRVKEYIFLISIAWCLGLSQLAGTLGLSDEIGAFIAGVTLASSPISIYIAESMKPVRDFFLVLFFFSVGAGFNLDYLSLVIVPAFLLMLILFFLKPIAYQYLLRNVSESKQTAAEVGWRLGQISEFSLIIAYVGLQTKLIGPACAYLIEATTMLSFILSSYVVVMRYPTPMALDERLRRD
jgi:Kef-type K+ transport system membrane component KefB